MKSEPGVAGDTKHIRDLDTTAKISHVSDENKNSATVLHVEQIHQNECVKVSSAVEEESSDVHISGKDGRVSWKKSPSPTSIKSVPIIVSQHLAQKFDRSMSTLRVDTLSCKNSPNYKFSKQPEKSHSTSPISTHLKDSTGNLEQYCLAESESEAGVATGSSISSSLFNTETDLTIGDSTELPENLWSPTSCESGELSKTHLTSESPFSSYGTLMSTDSSATSCNETYHHLLKHKDSLTLCHKSKDYNFDDSETTLNSAAGGITSNITEPASGSCVSFKSDVNKVSSIGFIPISKEKPSTTVTFLVPSQSEVTQPQGKRDKPKPTSYRPRILHKESAPSLTTPIHRTYKYNKHLDRLADVSAESSQRLKTDDTIVESLPLANVSNQDGKPFPMFDLQLSPRVSSEMSSDWSVRTSTISSNLSPWFESSTCTDSAEVSANPHGSINRNTTNKNNSNIKDSNGHKEFAYENKNNSGNTRTLLIHEAIESKDDGGPLPDCSVQSTSEVDRSKIIRRSITELSPRSRETIDKYLETSTTPEATADFPSEISETGTSSVSFTGPLNERDATQFYFLCNISGNDDDDDDDYEDVTPRACGGYNGQIDLEPTIVKCNDPTANNVKIVECKSDLDTHVEPVVYTKKEVEAIPDSTTGSDEVEFKPQRTTETLLENIRCSVRELEKLIIESESDLDTESDLNNDLELGEDNETCSSVDDEVWQVNEDMSNTGQEDDCSVENLSDTFDSVKEKFCSLVQHQTSLVKVEESVSYTVEGTTHDENEKPRTMEEGETNKSSNNGCQNINGNANTETDEQYSLTKWGVYDKFPSLAQFSEERFEDDETYDYEYAYEGFTCNPLPRSHVNFLLVFHC